MFHMIRHAVSVAQVSCLQLQAILGSALNNSTTFLDGITRAYCHEQVNGLPSNVARFTPTLCHRRRLESSHTAYRWCFMRSISSFAKLRHCFQAHFREHSLNDSCGDIRRRLGGVSGPAIIEASDALIVGEFDHNRQEKLHGRVIQEQCCWIRKW